VAKLLDSGTYGGRPYLVQEYVPGPSLEHALAECRGSVAEITALRIAIQLGEALQQTERAGLIHRDVRLANVLLCHELGQKAGQHYVPESATVKLIDFGLARAVDEPRRTQATICMASAECAAPEQVLGLPLDPRCDQYALGVLLYRLLTGMPLYEGTAVEVLAAHVSNPVSDPGEYVRSLCTATRQLVCTALSKHADNRHRDFVTLVQRAKGALSEADLKREESGTVMLLRKPLVVQSSKYFRREGTGAHASTVTRHRRRERGVDKHQRKELERYQREEQDRQVVPHGYRMQPELRMAVDDPGLGSKRIQRSTSGRARAISAARSGGEDFSDIQPILDAQQDRDDGRRKRGAR